MASYKVIQDIEAEDKLIGPLTLKQFIYAGIAAVCLYICFLGYSKHFLYIIAVFLPVAVVSGFFAFPWGRDQPTETWALAKIRFLFKPRRRIWDQSGTKELVSITIPKQIEDNFTNGLTQTEVKSRLRALADTIDSRGWAVKSVNVNLNSQPAKFTSSSGSDRLIDLNSLPHQVPSVDISAADDIMDEVANPTAQHFERMIEASERTHRQNVIEQVRSAVSLGNQTSAVPDNFWFMDQPVESAGRIRPGDTFFQGPQVIAPGSTEEDMSIRSAEATPAEEALAKKIESQSFDPNPANSHLRIIQPLSAQAKKTINLPARSVTQTPDPVILGLANNNDRNVASIAREINKTRHKGLPTNEVVISLH